MGKRRGSRDRVLVVDDDALLGELVITILGARGYAVEHVLSGEEALAFLRSDPAFDLVLMDIRLGTDRMTGGEAASAISAHIGLPIVFYSGYADEETLRETDAVPAYGYVQKTSDGESVLVRSVHRALEQHARVSKLQEENAETRSLLREAHHRIKNNLAVLAARLRLETPHLPEACRSLTERFRGQVHSIEKLHGLLQDDGLTGRIEITAYLERVLSTLFDQESPVDVLFAVTGPGLEVPPRTAAPIGMIVSEIAMNSMKHSFSSATRNRFEVFLYRKPEDVVVRITTSGSPIPEGVDFENAGLGMRLVHILTRQLRGSFVIRRHPQPEFILSFPAPSG